MAMNSQKNRSNLGASVRARLLTLARKNNRDHNALLVQYAQERFLYRLSLSPHRDNFILRGALLLISYNLPLNRPTKNIDFLAQGINQDLGSLKKVFLSIAGIHVEDGIEFPSTSITVENIKDNENGEARVHLKGTIGGAACSLQVDIGFGDIIVSGPIKADFPTLLDFPVPNLKVYSLESAVAEKFELIVKFNSLSSRAKDFYDINFLASVHPFTMANLKEAMIATFKQRGTDIDSRKAIFKKSFRSDEQMNTFWTTFLKRNSLDLSTSFSQVVKNLENFIEPIFKDNPQQMVWQPDTQKWVIK